MLLGASSQMDARVNEVVQLALSQRGTAGSHPDVVISPASQRRSSCASTAAPDVQADQHPQIEPLVVDDKRYPVDVITMPTACELHVWAKNISIHVAYGSALPLNPCTTIHGRPIPPGYTSVTVEQIVGNNENLELDFVGGDGEKTKVFKWCQTRKQIVQRGWNLTISTKPVGKDNSKFCVTYNFCVERFFR